jgi:hypothetical protein
MLYASVGIRKGFVFSSFYVCSEFKNILRDLEYSVC